MTRPGSRAPSSAGARAIRCKPRAGRAVRHAAAAARARSRRARARRSARAVRRRRRGAARDRLRRRRASDRGGGAQPAHRLHRHRAVRQRHGEGAGGDRRAQARATSGCITATPPTCSPGCRRRRSRASICSIPIRGRSGGTGSGASCRTRASRRSRGILRPGGEFRFASDIPDYVAWTLVRLLRSPDFAWTAERADDWRQPWPGFTGDALRGQGQARRPRALLSDLSTDDDVVCGAQAALLRPASRTCQNRTTRCAVAGDSRSKLAKALSSDWLDDVPLPPGRAVMIAPTVGQPQPAALQRIRIGSGRSPAIRRSTTSIGTPHSTRQRRDRLLEFAVCLAKSTSAASSSLPA